MIDDVALLLFGNLLARASLTGATTNHQMRFAAADSAVALANLARALSPDISRQLDQTLGKVKKARATKA